MPILRPPTVETVCITQMRFSGNVTPNAWYKRLLVKSGKPHMVAITLLSEICWWHRDREIRDESGLTIGWERKFCGETLQMSPKQFSTKFGFSAKQCQRALEWLEGKGLIRRSLETVNTKVGSLGNVCFIRVIPAAIEKITCAEEHPLEQDLCINPSDASVQSHGLDGPNITRTTRREQKTPKSPKRGPKLSSGFKKHNRSVQHEVDADDIREVAVPGHHGRGRDWVKLASADPMARDFLTIIGLDSFPANGRAALARSFVQRRQAGRITDPDLHLLVRMRGGLPRCKDPIAWLRKYDEWLHLAQDLLEAEQSGFADASDDFDIEYDRHKFILRAADRCVQANPDPANLLGSGVSIQLPRWALLIAYRLCGCREVERFESQCREDVINELRAEPLVWQFLNENNYDIDGLLGLDTEAIQTVIGKRAKVGSVDQRDIHSTAEPSGRGS